MCYIFSGDLFEDLFVIGKQDSTIVEADLSDIKFRIPKHWAVTRTGPDKKTFLDRLVFIVHQCNITFENIEIQIGDYVGHPARKSIADKFQLYIQRWSLQNEGRFLTTKDLERQFTLWKYEAVYQIRMNNIKKYRCTGVLSKKAMGVPGCEESITLIKY